MLSRPGSTPGHCHMFATFFVACMLGEYTVTQKKKVTFQMCAFLCNALTVLAKNSARRTAPG